MIWFSWILLFIFMGEMQYASFNLEALTVTFIGTECCNWQWHFWNIVGEVTFCVFSVLSVSAGRFRGVSQSLCKKYPILSKLAVVILLIFYIALNLHQFFFRNLRFSQRCKRFTLMPHWLTNIHRPFWGISYYNLRTKTVKLYYLSSPIKILGEWQLSRLLVFEIFGSIFADLPTIKTEIFLWFSSSPQVVECWHKNTFKETYNVV
jgi:hypothetical protein